MQARIMYKIGLFGTWKPVVGENSRPRIYPSKKYARKMAFNFKKQNPRRRFYFRIEPVN